MEARRTASGAAALALFLFGRSALAQPASGLVTTDEDVVVAIFEACAQTARHGAVSAADQRRDECARERLEAHLAQRPSPFVRLSLGAVEASLGHSVRAWNHLQEALASRDSLVEGHRGEIEQDVLPGVRRRVALVAPRCDVPGAVLDVNGASIGTLPLARPVAVEAGEVRIRVVAPGYQTATRTVTLDAGAEFTGLLSPHLARSPGSSLAPWIVVGAGAASLVASGILFVLREDQIRTQESQCNAVARFCTPEAGVANERAKDYHAGAFVSLGVGLAAVVGGAVWGLSTRTARPSRTMVSLSVQPLPGGAHLMIGGSL